MKSQKYFAQLTRRPTARAAAAVMAAIAALTGETRSAKAVLSADQPGPDLSTANILRLNDIVGATSVYNSNNDFGQLSTIAVVDLGLMDNTHPALNDVNTFIYTDPTSGSLTIANSAPTALIGAHATAVGLIAAGHDQGQLTYLNAGIAPYATLWSAAVDSSGDPNSTTYSVSDQAFAAAFQTVMQTGINGVTASVVNVSLGDPNGNSFDFNSYVIDSLIAQTHVSVIIAAGNSGYGTNTVGSPAVGFNGISVGALQLDQNLNYTAPASFSSGGPTTLINPYTGATLSVSRVAVDISAPGQDIITAASPVLDPSVASFPYIDGSGTSFAAPIVTGVAAQLTTFGTYFGQLGYASLAADANNSMVIKADLLNSADKVGNWTNHQHMVNGVIVTTQGLDYSMGAGEVNAARALDNFIDGDLDPKIVGIGLVDPKGWDLSNVSLGTPNDYIAAFNAGDTLTATLDWNVDRLFPVDDTNLLASEGAFINLDLEVYENTANGFQLIAESIAPDNNVQQLSFQIQTSGYYEIEVDFAGVLYSPPDEPAPTNADYALAWSDVAVPEPTALATFLPLGLLMRRKRQSR